MWKKYACAETFPQYDKIHKESADIIMAFAKNKKIYKGLKTILSVIGISTAIGGRAIESAFLILSLFNPNFAIRDEHKKLYNLVVSATRMLSVTALNLVDLDAKIKNVNPESNFLVDILNLKFNGDFDAFEADCDRIFNKETDQYVAEDFVALVCLLHSEVHERRVGKNKQGFINDKFKLIRRLSPYGGERDPATGEVSYDFKKHIPTQKVKIKFTPEQFNRITDVLNEGRIPRHPLHDKYKEIYSEKNTRTFEYTVSLKSESIYSLKDDPSIPPELFDQMMKVEKNTADIDKSLSKVFDVTEGSKSKMDIETAWKSYDQSLDLLHVVIIEKMKLKGIRNDFMTSLEAEFFRSVLISPFMDFNTSKIESNRKNRDIFKLIKERYNPLTSILANNPNETLGITNEDELRRLREYHKAKAEIHNLNIEKARLVKEKFILDREKSIKEIAYINHRNNIDELDQELLIYDNELESIIIDIEKKRRDYYLEHDISNDVMNKIKSDKSSIVYNINKKLLLRMKIDIDDLDINITNYDMTSMELDTANQDFIPITDDLTRINTDLQQINQQLDDIKGKYAEAEKNVLNIQSSDTQFLTRESKAITGRIEPYNREKDHSQEVQALIKYFDTIISYNNTIKSKRETVGRWKMDTLSALDTEKQMQNTFNAFYMDKDIELHKNLEISALMGIMRAIYEVFKIALQLSGKKFTSIIFDAERGHQLFDEVLGLIAGSLLGPKYLSKNIINDKDMMEKYAKEVITIDGMKPEDPMLNDLIDDIILKISEEKPYKLPSEREEKEFNILVDREDLSELKQQHLEMTQRLKRKMGAGKKKKNKPVIKINEKNHKRKIVKNLIQHKQAIDKNPKKYQKEFTKDPFLKGSYAGMIANQSYKITMEDRVKRNIHKLLCKLSLKTKNMGKIFSQSMTLTLAMTYIMKRLSAIVINHYIQHRMQGRTMADLCKFVEPIYRLPFAERHRKNEYHHRR